MTTGFEIEFYDGLAENLKNCSASGKFEEDVKLMCRQRNQAEGRV